MATLVQIFKDLPGTLTMPLAFANGGLWFGLVATFFVGFLYTYCVRTIVKCSNILCRRNKVPSLAFADFVETAFLAGPKTLKKWAHHARVIVNALLVFDFYGCCCVYNIIIATNVKQMTEYYLGFHFNLRCYILLVLLPLIPINLVRNLKNLAPFSAIANLLLAVGMGITLKFIFTDLPSISDRPAIAEWHRLPLLFGTSIFAIEGIGVTLELGNKYATIDEI